MMMMMGVRAVLSLSAVVSQRNYEVTNGQLKKKQKHHDDDGDEGCPVSAVVSQGNYEGTNGHLEKKRNTMMMMGMRAVLSLQWCLRATRGLVPARGEERRNQNPVRGGGERGPGLTMAYATPSDRYPLSNRREVADPDGQSRRYLNFPGDTAGC